MKLGLRAKTIGIMLAVSTISVLSASTTFLYYDKTTSEQALTDKLAVYAKSSASHSVAAISFEDPDAAEDILKSLDIEETFAAAAIFLSNNELFSSYQRSSEERVPTLFADDGHVFENDALLYQEPIIFQDERIGTLVIRSDLSSLVNRRETFILIILGALAVSLSIASAITFKLQASIVGPIIELAAAAEEVKSRRDYGIRVNRVSDDEVGNMVDAFNHMLAEIQLQQSEVKSYSNHLEELVKKRTQGLEIATAKAQSTAQSLQVSEHRFRSLSSNAPIGIIQLDEQLRLVYANPIMLSIFQSSEQQLLALGWLKNFGEADQERLRASTHLEHSEDSIHTQLIHLELENNPRWINLSLTRDGQHGFVGIVEDITVKKRMEQEKIELTREHMRLSREAGMAEIATSVLHNVGNVLNSVNVSAQVVADRVGASNTADIEAIAQLLSSQKDDIGTFMTEDPRGLMIPEYLQSITEMMQTGQQQTCEEITMMLKHVDHIKKIVTMQQNHAKITDLTESVSLDEMVQEALELSMVRQLSRDLNLRVEVESLPPLEIDKHKVLQILVNLLSNAKHAIMDYDIGQKEIHISASAHGEDKAIISVRDTGIGISTEALNEIFTFGYTTKKDGHGFGLHSSANAAKQVGATLIADSRGTGLGSRFDLIIPRIPPSRNSVKLSETSPDMEQSPKV